MIPTDAQDRADTVAFYARLGLSPDGFPLGLTFDPDPDDEGMATTVSFATSTSTPRSARSLSVPAARVSVTDQLAQVLGTFAIGESVPQAEVLATLDTLGLKFSRDTLHKARKRAGITTHRVYQGRKGYWVWTRPQVHSD